MKLTKSLLAAAVVAASGFSATAQAEDEVTMNIGVTSNYVWRGVSQSFDAASVSGGIDYASESGFYAGTWVGSLGDGDSGFSGSETDFYFGFGGEAGSIGYDVGYAYFHYADEDDIDFGEVYATISAAGFDLFLAYTVNNEDANDDFGFESGDIYYSLSYGFDLSEEFSLGLTAGYYDFESDGGEETLPSYSHFQADLAKGDFTFSITKVIEGEDFWDEDTKFVVSWGTSF